MNFITLCCAIVGKKFKLLNKVLLVEGGDVNNTVHKFSQLLVVFSDAEMLGLCLIDQQAPKLHYKHLRLVIKNLTQTNSKIRTILSCIADT